MSNNLIIVESPTKVHTIKKFLGKNYSVVASQGHIRDLPKSQLGFDPKDDYEPKYITIRGKGPLLADLRKEVAKADKIYLATDPDREGEAISWHLVEALNLKDKKVYRITFNEITKSAVTAAIKNPRTIDMDLVDAQQARRMVDRVVGYKISPVLWDKVKRGLSAGRVQSAALKLICDRDAQIEEFIPQKFYTVTAELSARKGQVITADFYGKGDDRTDISSDELLAGIMAGTKDRTACVTEIKTGSRERKSPYPFTTSTMQQEASKALNFTIQKTMSVAQQLYEGITIKGHGTVGLITYLRTDSVRISDEAKALAQDFIRDNYGSDYCSIYTGNQNKNANIQDAHEAIRPADISLLPSKIKDSLTRDQYRLYDLIWKRFMASQMKSAVYDNTNARFSIGDYTFTASSSRIAFDGFMKIYTDPDEEKTVSQKLDGISEGQKLDCLSVTSDEHYTKAAPHYNEASLVKTLEELGIGRPSTYSPIISTLLKRRYISKESRNIYATEIGQIVNEIMEKAFSEIVDTGFTADMEKKLDMVEEGSLPWKEVIADFYPRIDAEVAKAADSIVKVKLSDEETDVVCENCGRNMVIKYGPHGKFLACPGFPECRNTKPYLEKIGVACPNCGKDLIERLSKKGRKFYCCEDSECDFFSFSRPVDKKCPDCGNYMVIKGKKIVCSDAKCGYSENIPDND